MKLLYYLKIIPITLFLSFFITAPQVECGSQDNGLDLNNILLQNKAAKNFIEGLVRQDYWTPISFHIVRNDVSGGGVPLYRLNQGIDDLNYMYNNSNLHFYQKSYNYIDNDAYVQIESYEELSELRNTDTVENSINIYIVASLAPGDNDLCGISSFISNEEQGIVWLKVVLPFQIILVRYLMK